MSDKLGKSDGDLVWDKAERGAKWARFDGEVKRGEGFLQSVVESFKALEVGAEFAARDLTLDLAETEKDDKRRHLYRVDLVHLAEECGLVERKGAREVYLKDEEGRKRKLRVRVWRKVA